MTTEWEEDSNGYWYMHVVADPTYSNKQSDDAFKRHLLLEFLDYLKILEYSKGYDAIYYNIRIRK